MENRGRILLVDDDAIILTGLGLVLERSGYTIAKASSGERALSLIKERSFDLIITDLVMKGVDGLQVLTQAKAHDPETMVIVLTGYVDISFATEAVRLSLDDYLLKPCENDEILFRIARCLEKRELIRRARELERTASLILRGCYEATFAVSRVLQSEEDKGRFIERYIEEVAVRAAGASLPVEVTIAPGTPGHAETASSPHLTLLGGLLYAVLGEMEGSFSAGGEPTVGSDSSAPVRVGFEANALETLLTVDLRPSASPSDGEAQGRLARRALHLVEASKSLSPQLSSSFRVEEGSTCRYTFRVVPTKHRIGPTEAER